MPDHGGGERGGEVGGKGGADYLSPLWRAGAASRADHAPRAACKRSTLNSTRRTLCTLRRTSGHDGLTSSGGRGSATSGCSSRGRSRGRNPLPTAARRKGQQGDQVSVARDRLWIGWKASPGPLGLFGGEGVIWDGGTALEDGTSGTPQPRSDVPASHSKGWLGRAGGMLMEQQNSERRRSERSGRPSPCLRCGGGTVKQRGGRP